MKQKLALLSILCLLPLTACSSGDLTSSDASDSLSGGSDSTSLDGGSDSASTGASLPSETAWSDTEIALLKQYFPEAAVDYIPCLTFSSSYTLTDEYYEDYGILYFETEIASSDDTTYLTAYVAALESKGITVTESSLYLNDYEAIYYFDDRGSAICFDVYNSTNEAETSFYFNIEISLHEYVEATIVATWTAEQVTAFDGFYTNAANDIPCYFPEGSDFDASYVDYGVIYLTYANGGTPNVEANAAILLEAGYTYDSSYDCYYKAVADEGDEMDIYLEVDSYGQFSVTYAYYDASEN